VENSQLMVGVEISLIISGVYLLVKTYSRWRKNTLPSHNEVPDWNILISDFILYGFLAISSALFFQLSVSFALKHTQLNSDYRLILSAASMDLGIIGGIFLFHQFRNDPFPKFILPFFKTLVSGLKTVIIALPLVFLVMFIWEAILNALHIPIVKQEMVDLLFNSNDAITKGTLILVAVVAAPLAEELIFRAGLFRFLRTRTPRWVALLLPATLFAAAHGSVSYFPPLVVLGVVFALAYENTGTIGTTVVAHALFNLNSILMVLGGVGS
jgi:uncharacterized protein